MRASFAFEGKSSTGAPCYSPDRRIEYSLPRLFCPGTRRERGSVSAAILDRASNEAPGQNSLGPKGCGAFGFWLRFSSVTEPWRLCSLLAPRQKPKSPATNCVLSYGLRSIANHISGMQLGAVASNRSAGFQTYKYL